jgi:hypothetical protein
MPRTTRILGCRLPVDDAAMVEAYANASGQFVSDVIRRAVMREVREVRAAIGAAPTA